MRCSLTTAACVFLSVLGAGAAFGDRVAFRVERIDVRPVDADRDGQYEKLLATAVLRVPRLEQGVLSASLWSVGDSSAWIEADPIEPVPSFRSMVRQGLELGNARDGRMTVPMQFDGEVLRARAIGDSCVLHVSLFDRGRADETHWSRTRRRASASGAAEHAWSQRVELPAASEFGWVSARVLDITEDSAGGSGRLRVRFQVHRPDSLWFYVSRTTPDGMSRSLSSSEAFEPGIYVRTLRLQPDQSRTPASGEPADDRGEFSFQSQRYDNAEARYRGAHESWERRRGRWRPFGILEE